MPYLRLCSPALSIELKRKLAFQLTEAVLECFGLDEEVRHRTTIHFDSFEPQDMAVGGELVSDGSAPDYTLEITERELTEKQKRAALKSLLPVLMKNFGLRKEQSWKVNIRFNSYRPSDFAVGGTFLDEVEQNNPFRLRSRAMAMTGTDSRAS
ncbi:MAG: hypothetical protein NVS9B15_03670 [Acidobacteriaceae bacterium]